MKHNQSVKPCQENAACPGLILRAERVSSLDGVFLGHKLKSRYRPMSSVTVNIGTPNSNFP